MQKSPLAIVKERFGDKAGLIKAVKDLGTDAMWLDRLNSDKGLDRVSNRKLLHLHDVLSQVKDKFGGRSQLIDALADLQKRGKDSDFKTSLAAHSTPRLLELFRAAQKRKA